MRGCRVVLTAVMTALVVNGCTASMQYQRVNAQTDEQLAADYEECQKTINTQHCMEGRGYVKRRPSPGWKTFSDVTTTIIMFLPLH
jgi:hypothetical protein